MNRTLKIEVGKALRRLINGCQPPIRQYEIEDKKGMGISLNLSGVHMPTVERITEIMHALAEQSGEPQKLTFKVMPDGRISITTHHEKTL